MPTVLGIDEAGRGPVIGPMVIAGVVIEAGDEKKLTDLQVKDSKLLTPKQRTDLFKKIIKIAKDYIILIIPPSEIDFAVRGEDGLNLNWLEARKSAEIINKLAPGKAIIDCPSPNIPEYTGYIKNLLNTDTELVLEHKADENYVVVSAASILAKVTRDEEIAKLKKAYGDIGSGYPADPKTRQFLEENWDKTPEIFRKSWACYANLAKGKGQKRLKEF
jgi:ribonuclease HII